MTELGRRLFAKSTKLGVKGLSHSEGDSEGDILFPLQAEPGSVGRMGRPAPKEYHLPDRAALSNLHSKASPPSPKKKLITAM